MSNYTISNIKSLKNFSLLKLLISMFLMIALTVPIVGTLIVSNNKTEAEAFDPVKWFFCTWGANSIANTMYQFNQTDILPFMLFSKSSMNSGVASVEGGWNSSLGILEDYNFQEVNEAILGAPLYDNAIGFDKKESEMEFNSGPRVNVFDRFGVAGLSFTSYAGEWKYIYVDACNPKEPIDVQAGMFYEGRLEPNSTWADIGKSKDVRTQQFSGPFFPAFSMAFHNHIANFFFGFTKFIVVMTIILINFAFSNILEIIGIDKLVGGDGSADSGMFATLFNSIFYPLVVITIALTGMYLLYLGIVKRRFRDALGVLARTFILYIAAVVASVYPLFVVSLPNNIAIVMQSIIIQSLAGGLTSNEGLCATNVGAATTVEGPDGSIDVQENADFIAKSSINMRSTISCQIWQTFLFKPWVDGQFGTDYDNLWANDSEHSTGEELGNENDDWVGDAAVPMGNGEFINNWAIFQLSTQTNAHSPINRPNEIDETKYGVSSDWWRIVDALSNYDEEDSTREITGGSSSAKVVGEVQFPIEGLTTSSSYGMRYHPIQHVWKMHTGADYPAPAGTPIYAVANGVVKETGSDGNIDRGNYVILEHKLEDGSTITSHYFHIQHGGILVSKGQAVSNGDKIALVGSTGKSTGAHLHLEIRRADGSHTDPQKWLENNGAIPASGGGGAVHDIDGTGSTSSIIESIELKYPEPKDTEVIEYWDTWTGNQAASRKWVAIGSFPIALIGLGLPLVFALLSSVYSIGIALLMAFAPVMFLMGTYNPHGWEIFKTWGQEVINLTIKRIVFGFLLVLSLIFTTFAIKVMDDVGWIQGLLMLLIITFVLWKFKDQILNSFASVSFAASSFASANSRTMDKIRTGARNTRRLGTAAATGSVASKKHGGTLRSGMISGAKKELRNQMYRSNSTIARSALTQEDLTNTNLGKKVDSIEGNKGPRGNLYCTVCGDQLPRKGIVGRRPGGGYVCSFCMDEGTAGEDVYEVGLNRGNADEPLSEVDADEAYMDSRGKDHASPFSTLDTEEGSYNTQQQGKSTDKDGKTSLNNRGNQLTYDIKRDSNNAEVRDNALTEVSQHLGQDITQRQLNDTVSNVKIPLFLMKYLDDSKEIMIQAWKDGNYDFIEKMYAAALTEWINENMDSKLKVTHEEVLEKLQAETSAIYNIRERNGGERVDFDNAEVWNVNGNKEYAYAGEDAYTKDYTKMEDKVNKFLERRTVENNNIQLKIDDLERQLIEESTELSRVAIDSSEFAKINNRVMRIQERISEEKKLLEKRKKADLEIKSSLEVASQNNKNNVYDSSELQSLSSKISKAVIEGTASEERIRIIIIEEE